MKIRNVILISILDIVITIALSIPLTSFADDLFTVRPTPIYQAVQNSSLKDALTQVSQRSGIVFKINTEIGNDIVHQALSAVDWTSAVKSLLSDYNYTIVTESKTVKTVIITGRADNGISPTHVVALIEPSEYNAPIIIAPKMGSLPKQYQNFPGGAVMAVSIPVKEIMALGKGKTAKFDSPLGQFNVAHDNTVQEADGSKTWVGHLADEGQGYRMLVSEGPAGIMGHITTPEGTFNLESVNGQMFMIDTSKLDHVGFAGDTLHSTMDADKITANAALTLTQLKTALDKASGILNAANSAATKAKAASIALTIAFQSATSAYNAAAVKNNSAIATVNAAVVKYKSVRTVANLNAYSAAVAAYRIASANYLKLYRTYLQSSANLKNALALANTKNTLAVTALTNYNLALKAYNDASLAAVSPPAIVILPKVAPSASVNPVLDIMVLYTVKQQTAAFAQQRLAYLVTASNQSYIDSGIKLTLRLVYAEPTTYTDTDANSTALNNLYADEGVFSGTAAKRVQYGADLVFLFRPLNAATQISCGTTYLEMAYGEAPNKWLGYGTISDGSSKDAMTGYYCAINTFTHEIGHSLGLVHDREYSNASGSFNYSYAWGIQGSFGTIMSYKQPVVMYFSTPTLTNKCANGPCGYTETDMTRSSDQVKSVNLTSSGIIDFMPTMVASPVIK
jgi:hypothetical protein